MGPKCSENIVLINIIYNSNDIFVLSFRITPYCSFWTEISVFTFN